MKEQDKLSDLSLFSRAKNGDVAAFKVLFDRYYLSLCHFVKIITGSTVAAEEIVQILFIKLWENRNHIRIIGSFKAYVFTATKNLALNSKRDNSRWVSISDTIFEKNSEYNLPDKILELEELNHGIQKAINELPEQARKVFYLKYLENNKQKEIAGMLNISENTVEKHITNALSHLRKTLSKYTTR